MTATLCKPVVAARSIQLTHLVQEKLEGKFQGNYAMEWGKQFEATVLQWYAKVKAADDETFLFSPVGLVVSVDYPWLAASPDALVLSKDGKGTVKVKCPYSAVATNLQDYASQSRFFLQADRSGQLTHCRSHAYYYQVQLQMGVTEFKWSDFVVWTPNKIHIEHIFLSTSVF